MAAKIRKGDTVVVLTGRDKDAAAKCCVFWWPTTACWSTA